MKDMRRDIKKDYASVCIAWERKFEEKAVITMTPAQRQYDLDLVASMQQMAVWIEPRSRKVSDTLKVAAMRICCCWRLALPDDPRSAA